MSKSIQVAISRQRYWTKSIRQV